MRKYAAPFLKRRSRLAFMAHNVIGHPLMEVFHLIGLRRVARWVHRVTLPRDLRSAGRLWMEVEAGEYFGDPAWLSPEEIKMASTLWKGAAKKSEKEEDQ